MNGRRTIGSQIEKLFLKAGKRLSLDKDDLISIQQKFLLRIHRGYSSFWSEYEFYFIE